MTGKEGQQTLVDGNALEYAVGNGVAAEPQAQAAVASSTRRRSTSATLNGPKVIDADAAAGLL